MKTLLAATMTLWLSIPVAAQTKPTLPLGTWGTMSSATAKLDCGKHDLIVIEPNRIVHKLAEGQGRCKVISLKLKGRTIYGTDACDWDKSVPPEQTEPVDGEPGFSIKIKSPIRILYNNSNYGLCSKESGVTQ